MMSDVDIELVGDQELSRVFASLDYKLQQKSLKKVVGNVAQGFVAPLKREMPIRKTALTPGGHKWHPPGLGRRSIGKKVGRSKKSAVYFLGPKGPRGDYMKDPFYLKFWEYGQGNSRLTINRFFESNLTNMEAKLSRSIRIIMEREMKKARKI